MNKLYVNIVYKPICQAKLIYNDKRFVQNFK